MEPKELEAGIRTAMATAFIEKLPEDVRNEIMAASVERTFNDLCSSYSMKTEIEEQLNEYARVYVAEYVQVPEVQARLKQDAHAAVDSVCEAVLKCMVGEVQRNMKSKYYDFVQKTEGRGV